MSQISTIIASLATIASGTALLSIHEGEQPLPVSRAVAFSSVGELQANSSRFTSVDKRFSVTAQANGQPVTFLIDTGASISVLTANDAAAIGVRGTGNRMVLGLGGPTPARTVRVDLEVQGKKIEDLEMVIVDSASQSLLGLDVIHGLGRPEIVIH